MENGKIIIDGLIGDCNDVLGVMLIDVVTQVKNQPEAKRFDCLIRGDGGNVEEGMRIHDYLVSLDKVKPVSMYGRERLASIDTVIFMAGSNRYLTKDCDFMIHLPSGGVQGTAQQIKDYHDYIKNVENTLVKFYTERLDLDRETVFALLTTETWLTASDCVALGIAKIYENSPIVARVTNSAKPKKYL